MAAEKKVLASTVHFDGNIYEAGTIPPKEIAELIDNPKAWASGDEETPTSGATPQGSESDTSKSGKKDKEKKDKAPKGDLAEATSDSGATGGTGSPVKPPAVGAGSGTAEWLAYAKAIGLSVADDAKKGDLVEAVAAHEKAQEA